MGNNPATARFPCFLDIDAAFFSANGAGEKLHRCNIWPELGFLQSTYLVATLSELLR